MAPYRCRYCNRSFESARGLTLHQKRNRRCLRLLRDNFNTKHGVAKAYSPIQLRAPEGAKIPPRFTIFGGPILGNIDKYENNITGTLPIVAGNNHQAATKTTQKALVDRDPN